MKINEIFCSIQGESSYTGFPCVFIRLTECNLRCSWCDTQYAFYEGTELPVEKIMENVRNYHCKLVEITGGEPLLQEEVYTLIQSLLKEEYTVLIETSGSIRLDKIDPRAIKIMDIKCPNSLMAHRMDFSNFDLLKKSDEVKFVILDRTDYEYAKDIVKNYNLSERANVLFSPVHGIMSLKNLAKWILEDHINVRLQFQLQKYIWDPETRGV